MKRLLSFLLAAFCTITVHAQGDFNFTLHNTSAHDIPLWIPGVMNPNLNSFSKSGVTLRAGQEIFFKYKGKKYVLLVVSEANDGQTLNVPKLIQERERQLDVEMEK